MVHEPKPMKLYTPTTIVYYGTSDLVLLIHWTHHPAPNLQTPNIDAPLALDETQ